MITISLCMIVKNEEKVLARCLDSVQDIMDEIIIIDTGSTDKTKEIASRYTDKIYDYVWKDDFSAARNFSFSKASMDYIYAADADEVINIEDQEKFRKLKEAMLPEIEIVQMLYCNQLAFNTTYNFDEELRPKLFKRLRTFQWVEPIHETVNLEPVVYDSDIRIQHMPLSNHGSRDFSAFQKIIRSGEKLSKKLHNMYARELFIVDDEAAFLEAESFFESSVLDPERSEDEVKEALCVLTKASRIRKDVAGLLKASVKGVAEQAPSEICYELGEYFIEQNEISEAYLWYYNAAFETQAILNRKYGREYPIQKLIWCCEQCGNREEARQFANMLEQKEDI